MRPLPASAAALALLPLVPVLLGCTPDPSRTAALTQPPAAESPQGLRFEAGRTLHDEDLRLVIAVRRRLDKDARARESLRRARSDALASGSPLPAASESTPPPGRDVARALGLDPERYARAAARIAELAVVRQRLAELESSERFRAAHLAAVARARAAATEPEEVSLLDAVIAEVQEGSRRERSPLEPYRSGPGAAELALVEANREALGLPALATAVSLAAPAPASGEPGVEPPGTQAEPADAASSGDEAGAEPTPEGGLPPAASGPPPSTP